MPKPKIKTKSGFTIIEVVLVLAIAGIIMMLVFIALPALQRGQRDTARTRDLERVASALQSFQGNNRGAIPSMTNSGNKEIVLGHTDKQDTPNYKKNGTWGYFYDNYVLVGSAGQTDSFTDPDGVSYSFIIQKCLENPTNPGENCDDKVQRNNVTFDEQSTGINPDLSTDNDAYNTPKDNGGNKGHAISIVINSSCDNDTAVYDTGSRKVSLLYKKEGGGAICVNV